MYSTCIFCHSSLGHNEAIENFPIGRRLAFDARKGRLWAICKTCGRWNLSPIEERWEAIEECDRFFRSTVIRASTDQIGLAKIPEGTDLIRVGNPLRPEFAAWRYTRHFARRRRIAYASLAVTVLGGIPMAILGGPAGIFFSLSPIILQQLVRTRDTEAARKVLTDHASRGLGKKIRAHQKVDIRIISSSDDQGWALRLAHEGKFLDHHGWQAIHMAHLVAPAINFDGAPADYVNAAVRDIDAVGSAERYFRKILRFGEEKGWHHTGIFGYPPTMKIAFEMLSHEEVDRASSEGELEQLETDWREAEEIAAIADNLFVPEHVTDLLTRFKQTARRTDSH